MAETNNQIAAMTQLGVNTARVMLDSYAEILHQVVELNPFPNLKACCDIPAACWLPRSLGELESRASPCGTALVRFRVTNCQPKKSTVMVRVETNADLDIKIVPESAKLGSMERKWFTVRVTIPEDARKGECYEMLLWVVGCNEHYLRWTVKVADNASGSCHEIEIEDCSDYVHHWYDHFYCDRPCYNAMPD